jgi:hypothetical protein
VLDARLADGEQHARLSDRMLARANTAVSL